MKNISYTIRKMTHDDVPHTLDLWNKTDMQEGIYSLYSLLQVDKDACNVAVTDKGEIIGACCAVVHHDDLAVLGMYVVRKKYRGLGIGTKLWDASLDHIGSRNGVLNAVPGKTDLYLTKGGFPILETRWTAVVYETHQSVNYEALSDKLPEGVDIQSFQESQLPAMFQYDLSLMGYNRELALELNCKEQDTNTFVAFKGDKCVGFGTIKLSGNNFGQVGPLYADDPKVAEVILRRLIVSLPNATGFSMICISSNLAAEKIATKLECPVLEECPRLTSKHTLHVDTDKVFAHFNLNFSPF